MALSALPARSEKRVAVRAMFERIAPRYDLMNRLMTARLDQRWRRAALDSVRVGPGDRLLDLACGTGDLAELAGARGAQVVGLDFARAMLQGARARRVAARFVQGDAERLPLPDASFDVVVCGFALRNFVALAAALAELARVLRPGGRMALLEVDRPGARWTAALHSFYFDRFVPLVGRALSDGDAYRYLPQSTVYLPRAPELRRMLEERGMRALECRRLLLGTAQLWTGRRAERP